MVGLLQGWGETEGLGLEENRGVKIAYQLPWSAWLLGP